MGMRGEEITSGAQRIHDVELLKERATVHGIPHDTLAEYINSFKYGAQAHGGAGFGLERIVKFYCNLHNIRKSSMFPRDPKRIMPRGLSMNLPHSFKKGYVDFNS